MRGFETLVKALEKERNQSVECMTLNTAKNDKAYNSYLKGKEEAFDLALMLLNEFKKLNDN